jgi:hypothetical protein
MPAEGPRAVGVAVSIHERPLRFGRSRRGVPYEAIVGYAAPELPTPQLARRVLREVALPKLAACGDETAREAAAYLVDLLERGAVLYLVGPSGADSGYPDAHNVFVGLYPCEPGGAQ